VAKVVTVAAGKGDILERREPKFVLVNCVKLARGGTGRWKVGMRGGEGRRNRQASSNAVSALNQRCATSMDG